LALQDPGLVGDAGEDVVGLEGGGDVRFDPVADEETFGFVGMVYGSAMEAGAIQVRSEPMQRAKRLGRELVDA
jgi:hypothetical protein